MNSYDVLTVLGICIGVSVGALYPAFYILRSIMQNKSKRDPREPKFEPMMVVCQYDTEARKVRRFIATMFQSELLPAHIWVVTPTLSQISGRSVKHVVVMPGVNLDQPIGAEGSLRDLLKTRQTTHIDRTWQEL